MSLITIHARCRLMVGEKKENYYFLYVFCLAAMGSLFLLVPTPVTSSAVQEQVLLGPPVQEWGWVLQRVLLCLAASAPTNYTSVSTLQILCSYRKSIFHTAGAGSQCTDDNASKLTALCGRVLGATLRWGRQQQLPPRRMGRAMSWDQHPHKACDIYFMKNSKGQMIREIFSLPLHHDFAAEFSRN